MIKNRDTLITKYLYFLYKIYKEGELNTRCDMNNLGLIEPSVRHG